MRDWIMNQVNLEQRSLVRNEAKNINPVQLLNGHVNKCTINHNYIFRQYFYCPRHVTHFGLFIKPSSGTGIKITENKHLNTTHY
jgi:hypothetical protein